MKIVVSTFNNSKNNYGAMFQSCGLYSFLTKMGYDVSYVALEDRNKKHVSRINELKTNIKKIIMLPYLKKFKSREEKFKQFASQTQNQIVYHTQNELYSNPPKADVYLSGSDQVWNPIALHEDLFLSYAPEGSRKISYAASMGAENIPEHNKERFAQLISEYSTVSVREDTVVDIIKPFTQKNVYQHIDPVFLKSQQEWQHLEHPYEKLKFEKYILVYAIDWNSDFNNQLSELKKKTGLPVVSINIGNLKKICAEQVIFDASPNEFLYLLRCACYVVATSFHGTAMSVIYNKRFMPLTRNVYPTRIQSLMRHFNIEGVNCLELNKEDFERINNIIIEDQRLAKEYLKNSIEEI